jgi:hypothetical protein
MRKMVFKIRRKNKKELRGNVMKFSFHEGLEELSTEESRNIVAGQGAGYWLGYITGKIANLFS